MSVGFSRQEYWSGLPFPSPGHLPNPGIKRACPALVSGFFTTEPARKPLWTSQVHSNNSVLSQYYVLCCFQGIAKVITVVAPVLCKLRISCCSHMLWLFLPGFLRRSMNMLTVILLTKISENINAPTMLVILQFWNHAGFQLENWNYLSSYPVPKYLPSLPASLPPRTGILS